VAELDSPFAREVMAMIRASVNCPLEGDPAATKWSNRSGGAPLPSRADSTARETEDTDNLALLSLSRIDASEADVDREICRLALLRVEPREGEPPVIGDRWM
jgi:hypothetical protein